MASTTSGARLETRPFQVARAVKPPKATARARILRLSVGNGWTRVIEPHAVSSRRTSCPSQPGSRAWWRYQGSDGHDVQAVAERGQLVHDAGHHLAGRGHVGREVGAQHDDVHRSPDRPGPSPDRPGHLVGLGQRPHRPVPGELAGPLVAQLAQPSAPVGSASRPLHRGGPPLDVVGPHQHPGRPDHLGQRGGGRGDDRAVPAHGLEDGDAEPLVGRRERERHRPADQHVEVTAGDATQASDPVRRRPAPRSRPAASSSACAVPAGQHQQRFGIGAGHPGEGPDQGEVVLVGIGDGRVHEVGPRCPARRWPAPARPRPSSGGSCHPVHPGRHQQDALGRHPHALDDVVLGRARSG